MKLGDLPTWPGLKIVPNASCMPDLSPINSLSVCMPMTSSSPVQWVQGVQNTSGWLSAFSSLAPRVVQCPFTRKWVLHNPGTEAPAHGNSVDCHPKKEGDKHPKQCLSLKLVGLAALSQVFSSKDGSPCFRWWDWRTILWLSQELSSRNTCDACS